MKKEMYYKLNNKCKDKKGFTLIELLAVIVVLSIIMLIGVYAVLPQLEKSKKNALKVEAEGAVKSAQMYVAEQAIAGTKKFESPGCFLTIEDLQKEQLSELTTDDHFGYVLIVKNAENYTYSAQIGNKSYTMANVAEFKSIKDAEIVAKKDITNPSVPRCTATTTP